MGEWRMIWRTGRAGCRLRSSKIDVKLMEGADKGQKINDEYKGSNDRTLGNTSSDWKGVEFLDWESEQSKSQDTYE